MANTNLDNITPKLLAQGLLALRQNAVMTRLVNRSYDTLAAVKGAVINVPLPSAIAARDVSPSATIVTNTDSDIAVAQVTLDFWKAADFFLTDKEAAEVDGGFMPMQASEAIKSLANAVDAYIMSKHVGFYGAAGTAGTTPFNTSLTVAGTARKLLNKQLAPMDNRAGVLDPDAESNFLLNANILQADQRGDDRGLVDGSIGRKLGFDWFMDQNVTTYTPGTAWVTGFTVATAAVAAGATTISIQEKGGDHAAGTIKAGDIFTLGGSTQQYVVRTAIATVTVSASGAFSIAVYPAIASAHLSSVALTVIGTAYVANLAFHRDALAWASRPLGDLSTSGNTVMSAADPVSGIALRIEVIRQNKQTKFEYDILGGANFVRREYGAKILG